jgi:hypothetical protein
MQPSNILVVGLEALPSLALDQRLDAAPAFGTRHNRCCHVSTPFLSALISDPVLAKETGWQL